MLLGKEITAFFENRKKSIKGLRGKNADLLIMKSGGTYCYHWALKG
jgi:hypothetical protein